MSGILCMLQPFGWNQLLLYTVYGSGRVGSHFFWSVVGRVDDAQLIHTVLGGSRRAVWVCDRVEGRCTCRWLQRRNTVPDQTSAAPRLWRRTTTDIPSRHHSTYTNISANQQKMLNNYPRPCVCYWILLIVARIKTYVSLFVLFSSVWFLLSVIYLSLERIIKQYKRNFSLH